MAHEVELKFDVAPEDVERLRACAALADRPPRTADYETVYFDTKSGALRRAGFSLRVRRSGKRYVQAIKRKRGAAAGLFVRQEWEKEVGGFQPDRSAPLRAPLKRLVKGDHGAPLVAVIRTRFRRTAWQVARKGSRIEVVLDRGEVRAGKARAPLCELELELIEGKPKALFDLAEEIGRAVPLRLGVLTKGERGAALTERRLGLPAKAEPVAVQAGFSEGDALRAAVRSCLRHYRLNEIVLLASRDAEALHQARIALRRLRSALALFRPSARGNDYRLLRDELGWLARQFGDARGLDVLLAGEAGPVGGARLRERLTTARAKAYRGVEATLASERARALMLRLALWIEAGAWRFRERAACDVGELARRQLERQWRRIRRRGAGLGKAGAEDLHRLRLDVKKLRYAAEFLAGLWPKRPLAARRDRFIVALRDLQDRLGDLNDAAAAEAMTARLAPDPRGAGARRPGPEGLAAAEEALHRATAAAGYWA